MADNKGLIIGGPARSGKTQLAEKIHKNTGFSLICGDFIIGALERFPELNVHQGQEYHEFNCERVFPFLKTYMELHLKWSNYSFVFDSTHLWPETVFQEKLHEQYKVAFLGYPNISVEGKLKYIRQYPSHAVFDWTQEISDDDMRPLIGELIDLSKRIEEQCKKTGIPFFDTSSDFKGTLDKAYKYFSD